MARKIKPLTIAITHPDLLNTLEVQNLIDKGHQVEYVDMSRFDVVCGPFCWRLIPTMGKLQTYLTLMIAGVRAVKYPKQEAV